MTKRRRIIRHAADLLTARNVPVARAATVLARERNSPITGAIKLCGDDEAPFKNLIAAKTPLARRWRKMMASPAFSPGTRSDQANRLSRLEFREFSGESGLHEADSAARLLFERADRYERHTVSEDRDEKTVLKSVRRRLGNPGAAKSAQCCAHLRGNRGEVSRTAELIFPRGARFGLLKPSRTIKVVRGGQTLGVPFFAFEEI
ncbi:MAG TPA: hypothetical protein VGG34_02800 [Opitutaceae bacterium]|jgi:hypothetical protein